MPGMAAAAPRLHLLLLFALTLTALANLNVAGLGISNTLLFGTRRPGDQLLFEYSLNRIFRALQVLTESVNYPMTPGQKTGLITQIEVIGTGSIRSADEIKIKNGGVNEKFVQIIFKSARGRGLNYKIRIYGFPANALTTARPARHLAAPERDLEPAEAAGEGLDGSEEEAYPQ